LSIVEWKIGLDRYGPRDQKRGLGGFEELSCGGPVRYLMCSLVDVLKDAEREEGKRPDFEGKSAGVKSKVKVPGRSRAGDMFPKGGDEEGLH